MLRILFVCTGNAGRSQMAAAFAERVAPKGVEITSAGDVRQDVAPTAGRVMEEVGLTIRPRVDRTLESVASEPFDIVVTLCNNARELCPTFPGSPARIHWPRFRRPLNPRPRRPLRPLSLPPAPPMRDRRPWASPPGSPSTSSII